MKHFAPGKILAVTGTALLTVLMLGCSTVGSRISDHQDIFDSYPPDIQQQIRAGQVNVGFTPDMVRLALGDPDDDYTRTTANGQAEVWGYRDSSPLLGLSLGIGGFSGGGLGGGVGIGTSTGGHSEDKVRVVFENGRVASVERTVKGR